MTTGRINQVATLPREENAQRELGCEATPGPSRGQRRCVWTKRAHLTEAERPASPYATNFKGSEAP